MSYGVDTYNAHKAVHGDNSVQQHLTTKNSITGIGAILVNLRKSNNLTDAHVRINDVETGEQLISVNIPKEQIQDDKFAYALFEDAVVPKGRNIQIVISAPDASNQNAIGVRFDPKNDNLALSLQESTPLWQTIITIVKNKQDSWKYVIFAVLGSCLFALPALFPTSKKSWVIALCIIAMCAFAIRIATIPRFGGVSGGDAYNYLSISQNISKFKNPFENTKRLPGYPLILTPFYTSELFSDHAVMRYSQAIASIIGIFLIAGIVRTINLSWPTAIAASVILAFQKDYFFTAIRPEPYSIYTAFLLASLLLFFLSYKNNKKWIFIAFGLCLGYGAMVRQEGFMLAAIFGACSVIYELYEIYLSQSRSSAATSVKRLLWMYIPALCMVLPFFIHNTFTYGHPLYTEYFEGDRLQIVDSFLAFQDSLGATWGVLGSMWKPSWDSLQRFSLAKPLFIFSGLFLWVWYALLKITKETSYTKYITFFASISWLFLVLASVYTGSSLGGFIPVVTAAWILASIPVFLVETKWKGLVILVIAVSQILIATWFHPFPKHYQQSYPLVILIVATALVSQVPQNKRLLTYSTLAVSMLPFLIIAVYLAKNMNAEIDRYNANTALDSVTYRAARYARSLPGPIGFDQAYLPARLYFDPDAKYFPDEDHPTPEMEQEWLEKNHLQTIVVSNGNNVFKRIPQNWIKIKDFKAAGNDEKIFVSTIYAIPF